MTTDFDERYTGVNYPVETPKTIRLPDGREFATAELLAKSRQNQQSGHIRTMKNIQAGKNREHSARFNAKYTEEEMAWLLCHDIEDVEAKYKVDRKRALGMLRYVHAKVGRTYKIKTRKPDKRTLAKTTT